MAKSMIMFPHHEKHEKCHAEFEPVISSRQSGDSLQWDEYDSCYSDSEPQIVADEEAGPAFKRRNENEHHCSVCVVRTSLPTGISSRVSLSSSTSPNSLFCWLPVRRQESLDDDMFPHHGYRGIASNPPLVCSEGMARGNQRLLHRKAWLEVSDSKHRYGKHLRLYHRHWEETQRHGSGDGRSGIAAVGSNAFFDWLDSQGAYHGQPLPVIADCPRTRLDSDTVTYIDDVSESQKYAVRVEAGSEGRGRLVCAATGKPVRTGPSGWMFVLRDNVLYAAPKVSCSLSQSQRFHHSSFFGGRAVQAAGIFVTCCRTACLTQILPHSGHYRPGEADVQRVLFFLLDQGICWTTFNVDVQQFIHVDRSNTKLPGTDGMICSKKKKTDSLYLRPAVAVADYLSHKARCMKGVFTSIESRRK
jgi:hypothetical protein